MLDHFFSRGFDPGSNLKGGRDEDPTWLFLLPSLNPRVVQVIGTPPPSAIEQLTRINPGSAIGSAGPGAPPADLVIVGPGGASDALRSVSAGTPLVVFGLDDSGPANADPVLRELAATGMLDRRPVMVLPHGPGSSSPRITAGRRAKRLARRVDRLLGGTLSKAAVRPRTSVGPDISLIRPGTLASSGRASVILEVDGSREVPPRYLIELGAAHNTDLQGYRWALAPPRGYRSQKVIFFLYQQASETPSLVVKLTQDPSFNSRLANEAAALETLAGLRSAGSDGRFPEVVFAGETAGLQVVAETAVVGTGFQERSSGEAGCEFARKALESITDFGDLGRRPATGWAGTFEQMVEAYLRFYRPSKRDTASLQRILFQMADDDVALPTVLQHGDPGVWNLMVTSDGDVAFLDWESAEQRGAPLWDLFQFVKTYGAWSVRSSGRRYSAEVFEAQLLSNSPLRDLMLEAVSNYCDRLSIDRRAVDGLFVLCWVYQALKEVARLERSDLRSSRNVRFVEKALQAGRNGGVLGSAFP